MSVARVEPILMSVTVPLPADRAFDLFASRIASWWPLDSHSIFTDRVDGCFIEPHAGGRVYERSKDGEEHDWGRVLVFEPPLRMSMTWHPGGGAETEVEVRFTPADDGTFVELEHRGWEVFGAGAEEHRQGYASGWPFVFGERFVEAARNAAALE